MPKMVPDKPAPRVMRAREWAMLIALSAVWGGSFFFTGIAVRELPPLTIVVVRVGIAALALWAVLAALGTRMPPTPGLWAAFLGMGLLNNVVPFTSSSGARPTSPAAWPRS